jgi:uncharacterized membrane protein
VAALSYLMPPVSGLIAYLWAGRTRVRAHGLQSILFGALWPVALYGGSAISASATRAVFVAGLVLWVGMAILAALGRDVFLPGLARLATEPIRAKDAP